MCRVDRAEIMRLRGAWADADRELEQATKELQDFNPRVAGQAFYEIGEIRLRMGELEAAEEVFTRARDLGLSEPGDSLEGLSARRIASLAPPRARISSQCPRSTNTASRAAAS